MVPTKCKALEQLTELPVSFFISVMQAFHQNKIDIEKLQNQTTPKPIPEIWKTKSQINILKKILIKIALK